ncbi:putative P450 monooxygenase [Rhizodiscina lignyota]|uniref:P450 monooxygenase n=1 Tax=Rhizodiscina lignyota TaxID=1504668 RepID=A0A9P4I526_9PEZI|nr:putative P450 monooxygenase [Rhizodiscina lignyota]
MEVSKTAILLFLTAYLCYCASIAFYRLYLHPLAKFPGPRLAAVTLWYEFYYDVVLRGRYTWKIDELHNEYGPIIRINPYELHIRDPSAYDKIYAGYSAGKRDKWHWSAKMFTIPTSMIATVPHDHHRLRRGLLSSYFSTRSVTALEPMIRSAVNRMCTNIQKYHETGQPMRISDAFASLTMDVITEYTFSSSYHCVDSKDFEGGLRFAASFKAATQSSHLVKQFGWLIPMLKSMPLWLAKLVFPPIVPLIEFELEITDQVLRTQRDEIKGSDMHLTVFQELWQSDCDPSEKTTQRLVNEGQSIVAAGMLTTHHFLETTTFLILSHPEVLEKLRKELIEAMPTPETELSVAQIEKLPYLAAVIKEGHRKSYGVMHRLQRVDPEKTIEYNGFAIPPGTPVGMSSKLMHDDPSIFPEPEKFEPERFLRSDVERLDRYLVHFSKGTRMCIGLNLANAEICLALSSIFRRLDLELYETTWKEDVETAHDFFAATPRQTSKGVRVLVK